VKIRSTRGPNAVAVGSSATYASDYSFLFSSAQTPPSTAIVPKPKPK